MKSKQQVKKKAQIGKNDKKSNPNSEVKVDGAPTETNPQKRLNFPNYEVKLIGSGIILGLILGVFLLQLGATLCEVNIGPLKFALPCSSDSTPPPLSCADYGIKITSPQSGAKVWGAFNVTGTYVNNPPDDSVLLLLKSPAGDYFPQRKVIIDRTQRTWQGEIILGDDTRKDFVIIVSTIGNNGRALFNYFTKVGEETAHWPAIEKLTDDIVECDRVSVIHEP
jgi:hypothetical protein